MINAHPDIPMKVAPKVITTSARIAELIPYIQDNFVESDTEYDFSLRINLWQHVKPTKKNIQKLKVPLGKTRVHHNKFIPKGVYVTTQTTAIRDFLDVRITVGEEPYEEGQEKREEFNLDLLLDVGLKFINYLNK